MAFFSSDWLTGWLVKVVVVAAGVLSWSRRRRSCSVIVVLVDVVCVFYCRIRSCYRSRSRPCFRIVLFLFVVVFVPALVVVLALVLSYS